MSSDKALNRKQQQILDFMKQEILTRGFPPSVREICSAVGLKSTSSVHAHLEALEKKGYIRKDATKPRAIEILDSDFNRERLQRYYSESDSSSKTSDQSFTGSSEYQNVPLIGNVAAGQPLLAVERTEAYIPVPVSKLPNAQTFFLRVRGESMVNAGILDGDLVLVKQTPTAYNGDMIVALVDDSATVKTFYKENGFIRLQPENDNMDPIIVTADEYFEVLGQVIGVMRFFL